jgi:hypothetical protein
MKALLGYNHYYSNSLPSTVRNYHRTGLPTKIAAIGLTQYLAIQIS